MRADAELFKDKIEISLDGRQIFYLFFGGAVLASLVFVLGVMVGRRVEARVHVDERPATSATRDPLAALDALARRPVALSEDDLAFPNALAGGETTLGEVDRVLASAHPAAAKPKPAASPAKPAAKPAPAASAREDAEAEAETQATHASEGRAPDQAEAKFTLQLSSFQERAEAEAFYAKLRSSGYAPYVKESEVDDKGTFYRVRLGGYPSYDEAVEAKQAFEKSEHIIAYVTRL
ncbi:SPOR domain-containing protein [Haliangium ochraceum]|uniref:Sporulation domain protein n=1 Tax=Haliangium ochraceum (strain DSM 14365 / JCM 11303 / SMP-2) TaxID=502025 RepID=D0LV37_HALO1|nr:SPOR domain-containing protein [Haliangium ochraceum]ACY15878.1 Sporulation domain protein [Haliangium ochraceum DSM 14365]